MKYIPRLIVGTLIALGALGLFASCNKEPSDSKENKLSEIRTINGIDYEINGNKLIQKTEDEDKIARFGVISDIHGEIGNAKIFFDYFKKQDVDGIIITGDLCLNEELYGRRDRIDNKKEIEDVLIAAAQTGLPVYVSPGNHEYKTDWGMVINKLFKKYSNVFDLNQIRMVDGDDFDFISNPCGTDFKYSNQSFRGSTEQIREIGEYAKQLQKDDDPEVLITHQPPKCKGGKIGIDAVFKRGKDSKILIGADGLPLSENVGDEILNEEMRKNGIEFSLSGHAHEGGGKGCTSAGELVQPKTLSSDLRFNPGSACPWVYLDGAKEYGTAGIFTIDGNKATYSIVVLN